MEENKLKKPRPYKLFWGGIKLFFCGLWLQFVVRTILKPQKVPKALKASNQKLKKKEDGDASLSSSPVAKPKKASKPKPAAKAGGRRKK